MKNKKWERSEKKQERKTRKTRNKGRQEGRALFDIFELKVSFH